MEGSIAVAPGSFGRYGGDLVAAREASGRLFAVSPGGAVVTLAASGLPRGGDIGAARVRRQYAAYLSDRYSKDNPHRGPTASCACPAQS